MMLGVISGTLVYLYILTNEINNQKNILEKLDLEIQKAVEIAHKRRETAKVYARASRSQQGDLAIRKHCRLIRKRFR